MAHLVAVNTSLTDVAKFNLFPTMKCETLEGDCHCWLKSETGHNANKLN